MKIEKQILRHQEKKKFSRIRRLVSKDWEEISRGYIVDSSSNFIVLQESDDFQLLGFNILPKNDLIAIRYNDNDRYYDKITKEENKKAKFDSKTELDITDWKSVFKSFKKNKTYIIVECESPKIDSFTIGQVKKVSDKNVHILHFNATGLLDEKPTKIKFKHITKVTYNDRYVDIFSKYLRSKNK